MPISEDVARMDAWFSQEALHGLSSAEVGRYLTGTVASDRIEPSSAGGEAGAQPAGFDPQTSVARALTDPALAAPGSPPSGAVARGGNGPSTNLANPPGGNALAGIGSGIGGTSTGNSSVGGGSAGSSGGGASGTVNQLNTLGIQGAFAGPAAHATPTASASSAAITPFTSPPPPPGSTFNFVEGMFQGPLLLASFANPSGDPGAQYTASVDWGGGTGDGTSVNVTSSTIDVYGNVTYPEEGTFPVTVTVSGPGGPLTTTDTASVADAPLDLGGITPFSATAGQSFSSNAILTFSDQNTNAPAGDYSVQVDWGDGTNSAGSASGSAGVLSAGGTHTYTAAGSYPVSITVTDAGGSQVSGSTTATVSPPTSTVIANDDSYTLPHDSTLSVSAKGVLGNDTDSNNLPLSAGLASGTSHGSVNLNGDGSFTYTPNAGYVGSDSFTYTASDGQQTSNLATVTLTVTDSGTITTSPDSYSVLHDHTLTVPATGVLGNDSDSDGDTLTAAAGSPSHGSLSFNSDGSFIYTPTAGYVGTDSFTYTASDGASTSLPTNVTIDVTDQAPVAGDRSYGVPKDGTLNVPATSGLLNGATDADGDYLTASLLSGPSSGSLSVNPDGSFTYTPNSGFTGTDSFTYQVNDGALNSNTATVTLTVHSGDTAPVANADSCGAERNNDFSTDRGNGVLANDTDADGDTLTAELVSSPAHGSLSFNGDGSFDYTPNNNFFGTDTFTYKASDGVLTSDPATVTLTVNASPPTAADHTFAVQENNMLSVPSGALLLGAGNPDHMTPLTAQDLSQPSHGALAVNADGSFTYTPNNGFTGTDSFTYDVSDGSLTSDPATVTILVNATNSPPTAGDLSYTVDENQTLTVSDLNGLKSGASDPDGDPLLISLFGGPSNGALLPRHVSYSQMLVENGLFSRRFWGIFVSSLRAGVIASRSLAKWVHLAHMFGRSIIKQSKWDSMNLANSLNINIPTS
jgi:VCBS repeat-containing protein